MYGKLINNNLTIAPRRLTIDGCVVFNPTDAQYEAAGYLPVIYTPEPEAPEGYYPVSGWEGQEGSIVQVWHLEEIPTITEEEALLRYVNGRTGESNPDLITATESLITKHMEV